MYSIKVSNLQTWISELNLRDFFYSCGEIMQTVVLVDQRTGLSKCAGFVIFKTKDALNKALEKNGEKIDGKKVNISANISDNTLIETASEKW
jgi:nucleolin